MVVKDNYMKTDFLCTYFIVDDASRVVKIGKSFDIEVRLRQLQTGNGNRLRIALTLPAESTWLGKCPKGSWDESALHERFEASRIRGEWFLFSDDIRQFIANSIAEGA